MCKFYPSVVLNAKNFCLKIFLLFIFSFSFGQTGGFVKLRERFETIMGFQKPDLTSSVTSEEKVSMEITEKESEDSKSIKTEETEIAPIISESSEVRIIFLHCS